MNNKKDTWHSFAIEFNNLTEEEVAIVSKKLNDLTAVLVAKHGMDAGCNATIGWHGPDWEPDYVFTDGGEI